VGNVTTDKAAPAAAGALGRELAKAGFRILVYSSGNGYVENHLVHGYVASGVAARHSIQVRYPLHGEKPAFREQQTNGELFDWQPDARPDWEMSFYQSLTDVDGILLMGGGASTMIAGLVAMGHGIAMLPIAAFGGQTTKVWEALRPGRDLPSPDEISVMARPNWEDDRSAECVKTLTDQIARKAEIAKQKRVDARRREISVAWRAGFAAVLFVLAVACIFIGWVDSSLSQFTAVFLLFAGPLIAGVSGATIRLIFDLREGSVPLTKESAVTTGALGLIAGGAAGLLFIIAQVTTAPAARAGSDIVSIEQARKLVAFGVLVGFTAGLTLDAVFRKLITSDVVETSVIEVKKRA
jgi:hypothetical protein